ncbi:MAG: CidA/LrgA family protein [Clostridium sp.]|uniref:CidA/LrgA family protein n=1 Tax=Clostridium TaxID=1485 RepID=UPI0021521CF7|nr:CidA/LrgA family protein [Clostridium sp. LY3-2]MCR6515112.1 CidA/LrgA family protein [Clostridium sp. LY3-2]
MKLLREALIIFGIYLIGEFLVQITNIPVPGNIVGLLLLLICLCTKIIKPSQIETISNFFLDHLAFFFLPAGVGLMNSFGVIKANIVQILIVCIATTAITIAATGRIVQFVANKIQAKKEGSAPNGTTNK